MIIPVWSVVLLASTALATSKVVRLEEPEEYEKFKSNLPTTLSELSKNHKTFWSSFVEQFGKNETLSFKAFNLVFLQYTTKTPQLEKPDQNRPAKESVKTFFATLKDHKDVWPMTAMTFGMFGSSIPEEYQKMCDEQCITLAINFMRLSGFTTKGKIPKKFIETSSTLSLLEAAQNYYDDLPDSRIAHELPLEFWTKVMSQKDKEARRETCAAIEEETLTKLENKSKVFALFTPDCFANVPHIGLFALESSIKYFPDSVLQDMTGEFNESNAQHVTPGQVANLADCTSFPVHALKSSSIKAVSGKCLATYYLSDSIIRGPLGKKWADVRSDIFSNGDLADLDFTIIAKAIEDEDIVHIPTATMNNLLKNPEIAVSLKPDGRVQKKGQVIDPRLLPKLSNKNIVMSALLSSKTLDPKILAYVDDHFFEGISGSVGSRSYTGIAILKFMQADNMAEVVANISAELSQGSHACSAITDAETFLSIKVLAQNASDECIKSLRCEFEIKHYKENPRLMSNLPYAVAEEILSEEEWKEMSLTSLSALVRSDFCDHVSWEIFDLLPMDSLSAINSKCFDVLEFSEKLTAEHTKRMDDGVFERMTAVNWKKLGYTLSFLNDKQLPRLSSSIVNAQDGVVAILNEKDIKELGGQRFSLFTAQQIASFSDAVLVASIESIKAENLVFLGPSQIKALLPKFSVLTPQQVEKIGAENSSPEVIKTLRENSSKLSKEAAEALFKRSPESAESSGFFTYTMAMIVAVIGAAVALLIYVLMKCKSKSAAAF